MPKKFIISAYSHSSTRHRPIHTSYLRWHKAASTPRARVCVFVCIVIQRASTQCRGVCVRACVRVPRVDAFFVFILSEFHLITVAETPTHALPHILLHI